jgi:hypothetical protein
MPTHQDQINVSNRLNSDEVAIYHQEGYVLPRDPVFPEAEFAALRERFEGMLAALPPGVRPESMDVPHFLDPGLFRWLLSDSVLDLVEPVLGPDIALFASHFICKPAHNGKRVPWHEDSAYWRGMLEPMEVVTVWLALDASMPGNGCMRVIPRTHHHGYSDYAPVDASLNVFANEIRADQRDESRAVDIVDPRLRAELQRGSALRLHHALHEHARPLRSAALSMAPDLSRARSRSCRQYLRGSHARVSRARRRSAWAQERTLIRSERPPMGLPRPVVARNLVACSPPSPSPWVTPPASDRRSPSRLAPMRRY